MEDRNSLNRRNFLRAGILGAAGAVVTSKTGNAAVDNDLAEEKIVYRTLGKTGIRLPVVSMGVMRADNPGLVRAALKKGIVHLDTAHGYQRGKNETMLGEVLADYPRDSYVISTKIPVGGVDKKTGKFKDKFDAEGFMEKLDTSLSRLKTDHVDFLYLHGMSTPEIVLNKSVMKLLRHIKRQGKARFIGFSTHRNMAEMLNVAAESKFYEVVLTSYNFQLHDSEELQKALANAANAGVGIIAMKTMAGGFFDKERKQPVNTKAALKWALQNEHITTAIPGYTTFEHLNESFSVMADMNLSHEELKDLKIDNPSASLFCSGCEECIPGCKMNMPIPDMMRAYMYNYGYHEYAKAREVFTEYYPGGSSPCEECDECTVRCSKGFNVAERIRDVARIKDVPSEFLA